MRLRTSLADMGAEIIKVEPPGGDTLRHTIPQPWQRKGAPSSASIVPNAVSRSILKQAGGDSKSSKRLVTHADVLVHNFRLPRCRPWPGYRLYRAFKSPQSGPDLLHAHRFRRNRAVGGTAGSYDQVLQSFTGICTFQGLAEVETLQIAHGFRWSISTPARCCRVFAVCAACFFTASGPARVRR